MGQSQISPTAISRSTRVSPDLVDDALLSRNAAKDDWFQASLTIEGKISDFDITYSPVPISNGAVDSASDYTDYSVYYDNYSASIFTDNAGRPINPSQRITGHDRFSKLSQEFRISSPADKRIRLDRRACSTSARRASFEQNYAIEASARRPSSTKKAADPLNGRSVTGHPGLWWLTQQYRIDRDYAAFGQVALRHLRQSDADRRRTASTSSTIR